MHDLLWERHDDGSSQRVSSYPELRLDPTWVSAALRDRGLDVELEVGIGGQSRIIARR